MEAHATDKTCKKSKFERKFTEFIAIMKIFYDFLSHLIVKTLSPDLPKTEFTSFLAVKTLPPDKPKAEFN